MTSALAHLLADLPDDPAGRVRLREIPFPAQVELRLDDEDAGAIGAKVGRFLGCALPAPGRASGDGQPHVLWLGPGWYLIVDRTGAEPGLVAGLNDALGGEDGGLYGAAVEMSAARTVLELSGPDARAVLGHGCPLDLHPRVFGPGRCAQTRFARAQVIVHQTGPEVYRLPVRSSQAGYLVHRLLGSMTEYLQAPGLE
jgi:sarcosine oxidase subunit gamma